MSTARRGHGLHCGMATQSSGHGTHQSIARILPGWHRDHPRYNLLRIILRFALRTWYFVLGTSPVDQQAWQHRN
ncbi:MAG TPA: hypothetical protein VG056_12400, partial [Pirellulales bacterium]|nr:hypothetical protein [Pirellulales bacterium]